MQERFGYLDNFRSSYGYRLGKKTAWFSGKYILNERDVNNKRFWKTDHLFNVRYYSTFHLKNEYLNYYINSLISYKTEYLVGYPSAMYDIATYGIQHNIVFPAGLVKAIFPTAETLTDNMRKTLESFYKAHVVDQYASSEGAPFIIECKKGNLHMGLDTGVFEIIDEKTGNYSDYGKLIITSFTSYGTPIIRYDIGDTIELSNDKCSCSNQNPLVKRILGRSSDYVYSREKGKINIVNICSSSKGVKGVKNFQVIQNCLDEITINATIDSSLYSKEEEAKFLDNWRKRLGNDMNIIIKYLDEIPLESSGKTRIVKNNIKHLINI